MSKDKQCFSSEEFDVIREIVNISMGSAGSLLAEYIGAFVTLSVPNVRMIDQEASSITLNKLGVEYDAINITRQSFSGALSGEAIFIIDNSSNQEMSSILGYKACEDNNKNINTDVLLEISQAIIGTCIRDIGQGFSLDVYLSQPTIIGTEQPPSKLYDLVFGQHNTNWHDLLLLDIYFSIETNKIKCHALIFITEKSLQKIHAAVNQLML